MGRPRHAEDAQESRDEGRQEGDFRQNRHGQGEAGKNRGQGIPSEGPEGRVLNPGYERAQTLCRGLWGSVEGILALFLVFLNPLLPRSYFAAFLPPPTWQPPSLW